MFLLQPIPLPKQALDKALPIMEVPVDADLAPYLVSSLRGTVWVPKASQKGFIRTAFRTSAGLEAELIQAVLNRSQAEGWGSVQPFSPAGLKAAGEYLRSYEIKDIDCLVNPQTSLVLGKESVPTVWVPPGMALLVPKNRTFLGTLHFVSKEQVAAVVHNASRGMAFCIPTA